MKISLDYDDTYSADPKLWNNFINDVLEKGHEIMIVTARMAIDPIGHDLDIPVFYTSFRPKREYMRRQGINIDVWIDDQPDAIVTGYIPYEDDYEKEVYKNAQ